MPNCSVLGCGAKKSRNRPNITLHRLPKNETKKKKWLDIIGVENLNKSTKDIFICSHHFEETCFNHTLDVTRLRDEALPSRTLLPPARPSASGILIEKHQNQMSLADVDTPNKPPARPSTSSVSTEKYQNQMSFADVDTPNKPPARPSTSSVSTEKYQNQMSFADVDTPNKPPARPSTSSVSTEKYQNQMSSADVDIDVEGEAKYVSAYSNQPVEKKVVTDPAPSTSTTSDLSVQVQSMNIIKKLKDKCQKQSKKIKRLSEKVRRQGKKIAELANIIKDLKERNLLNSESATLLEDCAGPQDFLKRQILKSQGLPLDKQYSEEIRKFAITLHFFSPKAYDFVRRSYNTCLPHPRTLSKWYQHVNAEPGFLNEAFETLKRKVQLSNLPVVCALSFDEMAIRKSLCWDPQTKTYFGRINLGTDCDSDALDVASQCLVLLLTCINDRWKLPVGYFFITSLTGEQKAVLVEMCIRKSEEVGVKVVSITCDGPAANLSMFCLLGCDLSKDLDETTFTCDESTVHIFIDPCHAIKLIRNAFGEIKVFYDASGRKIDYTYLERLLKLQESEGLHMATKITKAHLMFEKQKMKVRLATQLLSNSVADALDFCENELKLKDFEGCAATINFIRILNDVFDVLNSHSIRPPGWKKAICPENVGLVEALFEGAIGYLRNLKLTTGQLLINSRRKTGFIGLIVNMKNALKLYKHLVEETKILKYVPMYKVSQDHLELFFSAIRARGGFNNNPNAVQFKAALKRLLIRAEIRDGGVGSCIPLEQVNILTCSSKIDPVTSINNLTQRYSLVEALEDDIINEEFISCLYGNLSRYAESVVTYIAGFVARKLSRSIKCEICIMLLFGAPEQYPKSLITKKTRGGLMYPSKDVQDILKKTEKLLKSLLYNKAQPENYYLTIFKFFMEYFSDNSFNSGDVDHDTNHKYLLLKSVIHTYMNLRYKYFGKKTTEKISFRNYLNKVVLFRNE